MSCQDPVQSAVIRSAAYSYRPPSPPKITVPVQGQKTIKLEPSYDLVDPRKISREQFTIVTGNRTQISVDRSTRWRYEQRRDAQHILDFLSLGPTSIVRDHEFLRREAFSMLVVVRDARAPLNLPSVNKATTALDIPLCYIDVEPSQLVKAFRQIVSVINTHLLSVHHMTAGTCRGKLLVTCDTGNMLSPSLVVAYVMAMFGQDMMAAVQFVSVQRFCANFDEEAKQAFLTWQDLNNAGVTVAGQSHNANDHMQAAFVQGKANNKRDLDDMMEGVEEDVGEPTATLLATTTASWVEGISHPL
ncbi:hypothetical protein TrVFT333_010537 [Trichoderma virens FT-333]|nr:hypothetical protein TrVFT333_010537 [Trichoderma virens FT-333]